MRTRDLFLGPEKPHAPWRLLLFLVCTVVVFWLLVELAGLVLTFEVGGLWAYAVGGALLTAAALAASTVMMRRVEARPLSALGLGLRAEAGLECMRGAVIGGGFIGLLVLVQTLLGWLSTEPDTGGVVDWLLYLGQLGLVLAVAAAAEELIFRGYPFQVLVEWLGPAAAVVLSSAVFAGVHAFNPQVGAIPLLNIGLAGVVLAGVYLRTRSLWTVIGLHWAWNWVMAAVFDLPVSGIADFDVPGYDSVQNGPDLLTGGAFGPEGGLLATLLVLPLIVWVFRTDWLKTSPRLAALRPLMETDRQGTN